MSYLPIVTKGKVFVGQGAALLKRVKARDGTALTQADVDTIAYKIYDTNESVGTPTATGSLVKTSVVFDTYQTDYNWTEDVDATGYNFRWECPGTNFDTAGHTFRVEVSITDTGAKLIPLVFEITTEHFYSQES